MPNTNYLKGVACPKCGYEDIFCISIKTLMEMTDYGCEHTGQDCEWTEESYVQCGKCGHEGKMRDFTTNNRKEG